MIEIFFVFTIILFFIYYASTSKFNYWQKRNIPYIEPIPIFGNYSRYITLRQYWGQVTQSLCRTLPDVPYFGTFYGTEPALVVQDLEVLKLIMTKDYYYFSSREISNYTHMELRTQNLFFTYGDKWKVLRQNLTPLFSTSKLKNMFYLIEKCAHAFQSTLDYEVEKQSVQEINSLAARFTMDCIGICAFGVETGTMAKEYDKDNPFTIIGEKIFTSTLFGGLKIIFRSIWPAIFYGLGMKCFSKESDVFFHNLMTTVFAKRGYQPSNKNDFVDLILGLKKDNFIKGNCIRSLVAENRRISLKITEELLVAQCVVFFAAGYESSSLTIHYTLYELAKDQVAQKRVIEEIDEYLRRHENRLFYECVTELPYTAACVSEALRLYPALGVIAREVVDDYKLPCGTVLEKGTRVHVPVYHLHYHPDHFPEPETFRPERFLGDAKNDIKSHSYMPFGEGPRKCIGSRFATMQMFSGIITVLKKYRIEMADDTPRKLKFRPASVATRPATPTKLKFIERDGWERRQFTCTH